MPETTHDSISVQTTMFDNKYITALSLSSDFQPLKISSLFDGLIITKQKRCDNHRRLSTYAIETIDAVHDLQLYPLHTSRRRDLQKKASSTYPSTFLHMLTKLW